MLRGGVIGLGKMGLSHTAILGAHPQVDVVAVCDTSSLVLTGFRKYASTATYSDYRQMLSREHLDLVVVATPTKSHYPIVKSALEHNAHVFCEKPFSLKPAEGEELVKMAKDASIVNQVGYHNHFIGTFAECKKLIRQGVLGTLTHFSGSAYGPVVTVEKSKTWRSSKNEGGGCLYDYASHVLNLVQELVGRPKDIIGAILKSVYSKDVDDSAYALVRLESGLTGTILVNWSDETYRKMSTSLTIEGSNGKIICDATELKIYLKKPHPDLQLDEGWTIKYITDLALPVNYHLRGEEYSAQMDHFVKHVASKSQNTINTFEQGFFTDEIIVKIIESSKKI